jgi:hypothetical protein
VFRGDGAAAGVPHGALLLRFAETVLGDDPRQRDAAREALRATLGDAALVDAAAIVASFNAVVKIADATGIPIEEAKAAATRELRHELELERLRQG